MTHLFTYMEVQSQIIKVYYYSASRRDSKHLNTDNQIPTSLMITNLLSSGRLLQSTNVYKLSNCFKFVYEHSAVHLCRPTIYIYFVRLKGLGNINIVSEKWH